MLEPVGDRLADRAHDIAGAIAHPLQVGPPVEQALDHHKLARTGHR